MSRERRKAFSERGVDKALKNDLLKCIRAAFQDWFFARVFYASARLRDTLIIRSRPFVPLVVLLIVGIVIARNFELPRTAIALSIAAGVVVTAFRPTRFVGVALFVIALGTFLYGERYRVSSSRDLRVILSGDAELVTVRGRMRETPSLRDFYSGTNHSVYANCVLQISELKRNKQWQAAEGLLATRTRGELSEGFFEGREVELTGVIEQPPRAQAEGLFDYRGYLHNLRIFHHLKADSTNDWVLISSEPKSVVEKFRGWAQQQLQRGLPAADEQVQMIWAMTLGIKRPLSGEASEPFMHTGTMHIFAVSGLHVACIAGFLMFVLQQFVGVSREKCSLITVPLIWFYILATGLQSSAIRSGLMFTVIVAGRILQRPSDLLNSTAAAAVFILLFQPEQLFQPGFQLSFVVVACLGLCLPAFERLSALLFQADPLLPEEVWPPWRKRLARAGRLIGGLVAMSVAAWLGSAPLGAYYFNLITLSSFVANIVAVPLSSVSLAATVFSLLLPFASALFNYVSWFFMLLTIRATEFFAEMPLGYFYVPKPNWIFLAFYFGLLLLIFAPVFRSGRIKWLSFSAVGALAAAWCCSVTYGRPIATITVLPSAGTPALVRVAGERELLVDCSSERDAGYIVERFLHGQGFDSLSSLLLTHGDAQTCGGFNLMWDEFRPETVFTSTARSRSPFYRNALKLLEKYPDRHRTISAGDSVEGWEVLHPPPGRGFQRADDNAIVLRRRLKHWTFLHLSDLGGAGQQALLENHSDLNADVVIAGMPENGEPLSDELLAAIQPKLIILGTSRFPYTAEGTPQLRSRLESCGATVLYTTECEAVTVTIRDRKCEVEGMNGKRIELFHAPPAEHSNRDT